MNCRAIKCRPMKCHRIDLRLKDNDKNKDKTWSQKTRTCKLVLEDPEDNDFPRGQQHWVTVKNGLLTGTDIYTVNHKKVAVYICDHNSGKSWSIFVIFALLQAGSNVLHIHDKIVHVHLT